MRFAVLASGSRANCTFVDTGSCRILVDCGLSGKETAKRLHAIGIDILTLDALIVTHEHRDHLHGVPILSRRLKIPVYANEETALSLDNLYGLELFDTGQAFEIGRVVVEPFRIVHDARDPVAFTITSSGVKLGHLTDIGRATTLVRESLQECHALVLESNHDEEMLQTCDYPWELKQRIASSHGHLSNPAAVDLLRDIWHSELQHVVLAHLSENSNTPEHALTAMRDGVNESQLKTLICGSPSGPTDLIDIQEMASWRQVG
ncbi:MAG: MBL fold metallo-hydrolase [Bdellovibrionales bacterium]|nr:MBL fold metallo-hydrolase [Bdellovibrionales bacterium]